MIFYYLEKSYTDFPDNSGETDKESLDEAVDFFYELFGDNDQRNKKFIREIILKSTPIN